MLDFKPIQLQDKKIIDSFIYQSSHQICSFTFTNLIMYGDVFSIYYAIENDMLIFWSKNNQYFCPPIGENNIKPLIIKMMKYASTNGFDFQLANVVPTVKEELEAEFSDMFDFQYSDNYSDYLYRREDLQYLQGKKYQSKRNHINQFKKSYNYTYNLMTSNDIEECLDMHEQWAIIHCISENYMLEKELCATRKALLLFDELQLTGGVLRVDGKVVAFTFGQAINSTTFDVCAEKAFTDYNGAYPMINQQFVENQLSDFEFVNREEDLGQEGLRKAKLSYYPHARLIKYEAKLKL